MTSVIKMADNGDNLLRNVFEALDKIREAHNVQGTEWSKLSGLPAPRISELRKRAKNRACTIDKVLKLTRGLQKIIGGTVLHSAIMERVNKVTDKKEKTLLLILFSISDDDNESLDLIYHQVRHLAKQSGSKTE